MFNYPSWLNCLFSRAESITDESEPRQIRFTWKVRLAILAIFFFSGAVGLIYEIVWNRMLTVVFGSTVFAVTTVLTAFMAGMAIGSYYIGKYADRHRNSLKIYAYLELGIGVYAVILPLILAGTNAIYILLHRNLEASFYLLSFFRFILCFIVLVIPSILMGGTLPVMTKALTNRLDRLGWTVGSLYALNTFGGVVGCFLAGFVMVKALGISATTFISAGINIIIAVIVLLIFAKKIIFNNDQEIYEATPEQDDNLIDLPKNAGKIALLIFGVSGFCALAYEVLWTRILVLFLGSTAYAFATMLSAFLCGIAIGSILIARFVDKRKDILTTLGIIQIVIALSAILLIPIYGKLYDIGLKFTGTGWLTFVVSKYALSFLVMLIPTILMGAAFPIASRIYANDAENLGRSIGKIYSINTLGGIFGSFFAGFVFIPLIGVQKSIMVMSCLNVAIGIVALIFSLIYWKSKANPKKVAGHFAYIAIAFIAIIVSVFIIDTSQPLTKFTAVFKGSGEKNKLLFYKEEVDTSVTVVEDTEGVRRVFVDTNQAAEDSRWNLPSHNIIGHIPILLHPDPKNALVIGFGMGVTSWAISRHGVNVDAVEISPGVVEANSFFTKINHDVLKDPLIHLAIDDGRNWTLTTNKKYDMISTGIIHPLVSTNSAGFYTKNFYKLCKKRLTENGIMCQWVPLYRLPEEHFKTIVRTFKASFPYTTLWYKWTPDFVILIGTPEEIKIDFQDFSKRMEKPAVKADLETVNMADPFALLDSFMMDDRTIDAYVGDGRIHTDNRPMIEFFGPQSSNTTFQNLDGMRKFRTTVLPYLTNAGKTSQEFNDLKRKIQQNFDGTQYAIQGHLYYIQGEYENSLKKLLTGAYVNPNDNNIKWFISHIEKQMGFSEQDLLDRIKVNSKDVEALVKLGTVYQNQGQTDKAIEQFKKALEIEPDSMLAHSNLAYIYEGQGKIDEAIAEFKELLRIKQDLPQIHVGLGLLYDAQGKLDEAITEMKAAIQLDPKATVAYINLGILYRKKGMLDEAIGQFKKLLEIQPDAAAFHGVLGDLYREKGDFTKAETEFQNALKLDPSMSGEPNFIASLALVYYGKGMYAEAEKEMNKAISIDPNNTTYKALLDEIQKKKRK
ncbi:MAG: fused MFS/spermidine synthase [Candidatus Poribacteria bacterium]